MADSNVRAEPTHTRAAPPKLPKKVVGVMQPSYLGWAGYFAMLDACDVFVLLDTVAIDTKSWQTRNRIRARDGNVVWLSVPTHAQQGQAIHDVAVDGTKPWQAKHWRTIKSAYGHAPHWRDLELLLEGVYQLNPPHLSQFTGLITHLIAGYLGAIDYWRDDRGDIEGWLNLSMQDKLATAALFRDIRSASTLGHTRGDKVGRIIDLCRAVGADTLLDTTGAEFLKGEDLEGINVEWFDYTPEPYPQGTQEWMPYLSVIDCIAHCGDEAINVIRKGYALSCESRAQ